MPINHSRVTAVLLADGWHATDAYGVEIDEYAYGWVTGGNEYPAFGPDDAQRAGICPAGFTFTDESGNWISGPLTSILAVRERPELPTPAATPAGADTAAVAGTDVHWRYGIADPDAPDGVVAVLAGKPPTSRRAVRRAYVPLGDWEPVPPAAAEPPAAQ